MPSLARSADIERQLLAPLEALLRDAQALLGVELDADRLEEAAGAASSESSGHPSSAPDRGQSATHGIARPLVSRFSSPVLHGAVDSTQPEALTLEPGAIPKRPFDRAERGFSSPNAEAAIPAEPERARFEQALQSTWSTPPSDSLRVETANHGAQDNGTQPVPPTSGTPLSPRHTAMDGPNGHGFGLAPKMMKAMAVPSLARRIPACTPELLVGHGACSVNSPSRPPIPLPQVGEGRFASRSRDFHGNEMAPPAHSQPMSREATSTTSAPLPSSATAERASMRSATPASSPRPYFTSPAPLAESFASCCERDAASDPAAEWLLSSGKRPETPTATMPSGDSRQQTDAETTSPAAHLTGISQRVRPAPESYRTLAVPLRPRQAPPPERSFATAEATKTPVPGTHLQAAARRLASAVDPSLEQAYRLTQTRLDTSAASASERIESPSLVRNTFNVTVALHTDDASASLDPTALADALTEVLLTAARRHGLEI